MGRIKRKDSAQRGRPAVPDHWTGRPGGSGAQPPLHLIYMVKVGRHLITSSLPTRSAIHSREDMEDMPLRLRAFESKIQSLRLSSQF
jgi:hypothetical protein